MTSSIASTARRAYWRLTNLVSPGASSRYPADFSPTEIEILDAVEGKTLTTPERIVGLVRSIDYITTHAIPGDIVECGVWKGGSMMAAAMALKKFADATTRQLYLFDTFDGMPPPTDADKDYLGNSAASQMASQDRSTEVWARAQLDEVQENMKGTAYPVNHMHFIKGKVEDTIPATLPERIALLRLDTDWYESTRHELEHLFPRLVPGGVLILDDYGHWEGARRAVDEYIDANHIRILLCRIDVSGRIAIKQQ